MSNKTNNTPKVKTVKGEGPEPGSAKRGRPVVNGSKRQAVLAMRQAKRDAGIEIKRGRPKGTGTKTTDITVEVKAKAPKVRKSDETEMIEYMAQQD